MYDIIVLSFTPVGFQIIAYRTKECKNIVNSLIVELITGHG